MLHSNSEVLSRNGWKPIDDGEVAHFNPDTGRLYWEQIGVSSRSTTKFISLSSNNHGAICVTKDHGLLAEDYQNSYHGSKYFVNNIAGWGAKDCIINNFNTEPTELSSLSAFNHCSRKYFGRRDATKKEKLIALLESAHVKYSVHGKEIKIISNMQYSLIEDLVASRRYSEFLYWHGRTELLDEVSRVKNDRAEFANYCSGALDNIQLAALGSNHSAVLSKDKILVYNKTPPLRITKVSTVEGEGVNLEGDGFLYVRYKKKIGIVKTCP